MISSMKKSALIFAILFTAFFTVAQAPKGLTFSKESFANASYSRLSTKISTEEIKDVEQNVAKWKTTKSEKDWVKLTDAVYYAAATARAISQVSIASSGGSGASVKYQTIGERDRGEPPTSAKGLTTLKESMVMGMYHVWSERAGKATSDKNARFPIVNATETIVLSEQ